MILIIYQQSDNSFGDQEYFYKALTTTTTGQPEVITNRKPMISNSTVMQLNSTVKVEQTISTVFIQDCQRYVLSSNLPNGKLNNSILNCPTSTAFPFDSQRCLLRSNYQSPLTQPLSKSTTKSLPTSNGILRIQLVQGNFFNQFDLDCNTYHLCYIKERVTL